MKRVKLIEGMFLDIATKEERQKVDALYASRAKGSAIVYMLKRIRDHWVIMINAREKNKHIPLSDTGKERLIKINSGGKSWLQ